MKVHRSNTNIHHTRGQDMPCFHRDLREFVAETNRVSASMYTAAEVNPKLQQLIMHTIMLQDVGV